MPPDSSKINVLLIGGGGREHAIATALARSPRLGDLWVTNPENPGLASLGKPVDVPVDIKQIYRLQQFCEKKTIGLVVIGPEDPLAEGYADKLAAPGRLIFGPSAEAARLESDKSWAKQVMRAASVPTAEARSFTNPEAARAYLETREEAQVIKAAGLAKGKGVIVPESTAEALAAIDRIMVAREFGEAGRTVVIEERLTGPEVSVLAIVDGRNILMLPPCQDHKRLADNDTGPNTGGMGAYCPAPILDDETLAKVEREVLVPTIDSLRRDGIEYRGVLYAGLMLTPAGPKVLEFNCRFGDPECQPLMTLLRSDLLELFIAACQGRLDQIDVDWSAESACCIVLASAGYPEKPKTGFVIEGLDAAAKLPGVTIYHAGTKRNAAGRIINAGGRVLGVTGMGPDLAQARARAYAACDLIHWEGMTYRRDIGALCPRAALRESIP